MARKSKKNSSGDNNTIGIDFNNPGYTEPGPEKPKVKTGPVCAKAWFDGSCPDNPGEMGIGGVIKIGEKTIPISAAGGVGTNNEAEYKALIAVFNRALESGVEELEVFGDSQLIVHQVNGRWRVKSDNLKELCKTAQELMGRFSTVRLKWIPREENQEADELSGVATRTRVDETNSNSPTVPYIPITESLRIAKSKSVVLHQITSHIFLADGSKGNQYVMDTKAGSCSCPDWMNRQIPCKHIIAAQDNQ